MTLAPSATGRNVVVTLKASGVVRVVVAVVLATLPGPILAQQAWASTAPSITGPDHATFIAGRQDSVTLTATGAPAATLAEAGTLPTGVSFTDKHDGTATLSGTPRKPGSYPLTITARTTTGRAGARSFVLLVTAAWYDPNWQYRKAITIDHTKVGAALSNFPVLISRTDTDLITKAQSTGNDILFTSSDGSTKLNHQIESFTSGTGALVAWVSVPSLSTTVDTVIYQYYGYATATNQQNATAVWDANFTGVWHLSENPTATAPQFKDSTSNADNGTNQGSIASGAQVAGKVDGSLTLDGTSDYISTNTLSTVPTSTTIEAWFKTSTASGNKIVGFESSQTGTGASGSANYDRMMWVGTDGKLRLGMFDGTLEIATSAATVTDGAWHHAVGVEDNTLHTLTLYLDGVSAVAATGTTPQSYTGYWRIGSYMMYAGWTNSAAGYFPGSVDEVRVSTIARSSGWITTEYNNQSAPSTFASTSAEQTPAAAPAITSGNKTIFPVSQAGTFTVTATGFPLPSLAETGTLPSGVTFVDNGNGTATLAGTPTTAGTYSLTVTAHNTAGADATQSFALTVAAVMSFATKVDYTTGTNPQGVAAGDFRSNGRKDLAVANWTSSSMSALLGTGAGAFATKVDYTTGSSTASDAVAVGDFNGDGHPDVAVANYGPDSVSVFLGTGTGTFAAKVDYTTGFSPDSVAVGDFNGDGKQDLVTSNHDSNTVSVLLGTGTGTFATKVDYTTGTVPTSVAVGDFNGDGKQDLAVTNNTANTVSILLGTGTGTFAAKVDYATGTAPTQVAVGDFSGDGHLDLAVANSSANTVSMLAGTGTGTFAAKVDYATGTGPASVAVADLNGDGAPDLVTANNGANTVSVLLGTGTGTFAAKTDLATGTGPNFVLATDLNADGRPDLAVTNYTASTVSVLLNTTPTAPAITSANTTTFALGQAGTFTVTATGYPLPTLAETGTLPSGVTFVDNGNGTATLAGTPAASGTFTVSITAHNTSGADATQSFALIVSPTVWYNASWLYRKTITIDHTKVAATAAFTVLVSRTDTDLAAHAQSSGNDILFTSSDKVTKVPHEIESYTSGTGQLTAWVLLPSVSSTVDTVFYMYYGNASATNQQNVTGTWDAQYTGVWHLSESPTASAPQFKDSTSNANNGTNQGSIAAGAQVAGKIDGSITLDGTSDYISTAVQQTNPQSFSISAWVKTSTSSGKPVVNFEDTQTSTSASGTGNYDRSLYVGTDGKPHFVVWNTTQSSVIASGASTITDGQWHYLAGTYNGSVITIYVDGVAAASAGAASGAQVYNGYWRIGGYDESGYTGGANGYFPGSVDEVRAATGAWASTTITTRYNNQSAPSTFVSVSSEQAATAAPAITSAANTTFIAGSAGSFTVTATGTPTPTLAESGALPGGVTFTDNGNGTATLAGTPSSTGAYTLTITAHNTSGADATQTFTLTVGQATQGWYNSSWPYRKMITIDHTKVGASLTNFPVLISRTDADLAAHALSTGNDILFTSSDGTTKLSHEIESYTSGTGALVTWVNVPTVSNTTDTVIYLYYGNASATNQQNPTGAWNANYASVWHLSQTPDPNNTNDIKDSTTNADHGTSLGAMTSGNQVAGQIDGSLSFDGVANYVATANLISTGPQVYTEEAWIKTSSTAGHKVVGFEQIQIGTAGTNNDRGIWVGTDGQAYAGVWDGTTSHVAASGVTVNDNTWHHIAATYDSGTTNLIIYVDGTSRATTTSTTAQVLSGYWRIGAYKGANWTNGVDGYFAGTIDEVRISSSARTAAWISTEYNNQAAPSTFVSSSVAQTLIAPTITSANSATFTAGSAGTFTVTSTGAPTAALSKTGTLPGGVTFVDNGNGTATLSGTPTTVGSYSLTITAHNSASPDATQTFTLTVAAGSLFITVPSSANLGSGALGGSVSSALGAVQVTDNRGSASAAWIASVSSTTFTLTGYTVPLANLQYWSGPVTASTGAGTFTPGQGTAGAAQVLSTSRTVCTLTGGNGIDSATWNPTLIAAIPITVVPGVYTGTITHSVV